MYPTPCLCSVGFFNRSDKSSDTAFREQSQRVIHLYAAPQMCIAQRLHGCQRDRVVFSFASVHQLLRDCAAEAHVDSEAEAKVLIRCIVSTERRRLAQASQVLEQFGIKSFRQIRSSEASPKMCGSKKRLRDQLRKQDYSMTALVSTKLAVEMFGSKCECAENLLCFVQLTCVCLWTS